MYRTTKLMLLVHRIQHSCAHTTKYCAASRTQKLTQCMISIYLQWLYYYLAIFHPVLGSLRRCTRDIGRYVQQDGPADQVLIGRRIQYMAGGRKLCVEIIRTLRNVSAVLQWLHLSLTGRGGLLLLDLLRNCRRWIRLTRARDICVIIELNQSLLMISFGMVNIGG